MNSTEIRQKFLEFFESKKHQIVESAPLVVKNDPTLMFINAGMNQFKDFFLGNQVPDNTRVTDTQKCLRVSGKHNDLEEVGMDTYHHTLFEMLGNWSFGDYFKQEAIEWAWELLTEVFDLPKDRLYITIFEGDKDDNLVEDTEAYDFWKKIVPEERILKCSKKDNFWEMGDTGPCGPCSEIHVDIRDEEEIAKVPGKDLVNEDHPLVIEIWNLVFIQFNRKANGQLEELPAKHIDTGMGFERLAMVIQGVKSNYDTDIFQPMIQSLAKKAGVKYGDNEKTDIALRVVADHVRAISFAISDGQLPSNNGAGYVIRRILRRAVRYGYTFLNFDQSFINKLVPQLADQFAHVFPELKAQESFVMKVIEEEENSFLKTLTTGIARLDSIKNALGEAKTIEGKVVFELYDTYGFPVDLTALIARENGLEIDEVGFKKEMEVQKERSRAASTQEMGDWITVHPMDKVEFVGYDNYTSVAKISRYREVLEKKKTFYQIVLDKTPFYPEGGGQVGDTGYLEANGEKISVVDTKKENDLIVHYTTSLPKDLSADFNAQISVVKRESSMNNHTATHLLQAALKQVLGDHVAQKGSLVNDKILRFDFAHFAKMTKEEILQVEKIVNEKIRQNIELDEKRNCPIEEATSMGATALFGEKYGDFVRVITFDPSYSMELCGGTHVDSTSRIGSFKIVSEGSVAAGVRRVEAITGAAAEEYLNKKLEVLEQLDELLKSPKDIVKAVEVLSQEKADLSKKVEGFRLIEQKALKESLKNSIVQNGGVSFVFEKIEVESADTIKQVSFELKNQVDNLLLVIAANIEGKPLLSVMIDEGLAKDKDWNAGKIIRELAKEIKGGGGGQPFYATAGGKDISGLDNAISKAKDFFTLN